MADLVALVAAAAIMAAAGVVVGRIHGSRAPVDTATVYGGDAAAIAIAITLLLALGTWWQKGRAARTQVSTPAQLAVAAAPAGRGHHGPVAEEAVRRRIVTPAPVTVRWHSAAQPRWPRPGAK